MRSAEAVIEVSEVTHRTVEDWRLSLTQGMEPRLLQCNNKKMKSNYQFQHYTTIILCNKTLYKIQNKVKKPK